MKEFRAAERAKAQRTSFPTSIPLSKLTFSLRQLEEQPQAGLGQFPDPCLPLDGKDYISYRDSRKGNTRHIRSIVYKDSIQNILGHRCFMVESVYESYIAKIWYAADLKIDPESFKDHAVGDWYSQIKEVDGSLSLKSVYEYVDRFETSVVIKITARRLNKDDFALPAKIIVASADALDKQVELVKPPQAAISCYQVGDNHQGKGIRVCRKSRFE